MIQEALTSWIVYVFLPVVVLPYEVITFYTALLIHMKSLNLSACVL